MRRHTGIELQLLTDIGMVLFVERGIRGGISQCSNHYSRANNPYVTDYNPTEDTTYHMYVECKYFLRMGDDAIPTLRRIRVGRKF